MAVDPMFLFLELSVVCYVLDYTKETNCQLSIRQMCQFFLCHFQIGYAYDYLSVVDNCTLLIPMRIFVAHNAWTSLTMSIQNKNSIERNVLHCTCTCRVAQDNSFCHLYFV